MHVPTYNKWATHDELGKKINNLKHFLISPMATFCNWKLTLSSAFHTSKQQYLQFVYWDVLVYIFIPSGGSNKVEEAVECYQRAANMFKMAKKWAQAGSAFCEAASLHAKAGSRHDAATNYVDASNCYKKVSD